MGPGAQTTLAILAAMVVLLATGLVPAAVAGLLAAGSFLLSGILNVEQLYRAINWTTVILVGAMMLLSVAIQETGAARLLAEGLVTLVGDARAHSHPDLGRDRHADGRLARARAHGGGRGGRGGVPDPGRNAHEPHGDGARLLQVHRLLKVRTALHAVVLRCRRLLGAARPGLLIRPARSSGQCVSAGWAEPAPARSGGDPASPAPRRRGPAPRWPPRWRHADRS
jgi:hypothetical protein